MSEYHVGCGVFGIYAGTLNKSRNMWNKKSDVTAEALRAVAQFLLVNEEALSFYYEDKHYKLVVESVESEE